MNIEVCFKTWEHQGSNGYVFLAAKEYDGTTGKSGKPNGDWEDKRFSFPQEKDKIKAWALRKSQGKRVDLYWCPNIFTSRSRKEGVNGENIKPCRVLYADLDFVNPEEVPYRPTVAWQSSPDRFQCVWFLENKFTNPVEFSEVNKKMTYLTGADKSGWDLTQVLRIPDLDNHKTDPPTTGKLLWARYKRQYKVSDFKFDEAPAMTMDLKLTGSFYELVEKNHKKLEKAKILHKLQWTADRVKGCDRSDTLWAMTREMLKVNIPLEDIASLIQQSAWNKYSDRSPVEERKRIITDINKAHKSLIAKEEPTEKQKKAIEDVTTTEEDALMREAKNIMDSFKSYEQVMSSNTVRPRWLIDKIWVENSQGIVAGEAKTFKSTITTDIAMSVASGAPLWGKYKVNVQGPVLIVQVENNINLVKDRMARMGESKGVLGSASLNNKDKTVKAKFGRNLPIYTHIADKNHPAIKFSNEAHLLAVEMMVKKIHPVLIIFDPLYQLFDGDMSSSQELAPALRWLKDLRINYDTAVMLVHHYNKGTGEKGKSGPMGHRLLGSVTLHGWVECMLALEKGPTSNGVTQLTLNKEFRAVGSSEPLYLSLKMGDGKDDYSYEVNVRDGNVMEGAEDDVLLLLDIVNGYGNKGVLAKVLCETMNLSFPQLTRLLTKAAKCLRITGKGGEMRISLSRPHK